MVVGIEGVALPVNVVMNGDVVGAVSSFKYFGICFSKVGGMQKDAQMRVGETARD